MATKISLKDFLKKYTAISNNFIDEYYKFYELCENNKYGIVVDEIIKYLELKSKKIFVEKLREKYTVNRDFVIKRIKQKSQKGIQDVFYYVSFDCFEKICMSSKSKKANDVRDYFITLRKFIEYYRQYISEMILDNAIDGKAVYILLVNKNKKILKLGQTTKNMRSRLYSYATGKDKHPDIKFIMLTQDSKHVEKCTKLIIKKYKTKRGDQELYKINFDVLKEIIFGCAKMKEMLNEYESNKSKYDMHVVFDDSKIIEYLDLNNNVVASEIPHSRKPKHKKTT